MPEDRASSPSRPADAADLATGGGTRATWVSLPGLVLTVGLQLLVVMTSGSVALLALLHEVPRLADAILLVDPHEHPSHRGAGGTGEPP